MHAIDIPSATSPRPFAFVLMPFDGIFADTYELAIKAACEAAGAYAERVDEQVFQGSILQRIYNQIAKADIVIADMSGRNANVFYETGYAHALGKAVVLLTRSADDIPFDLKHYSHIVYGGSLAKLKVDLEMHLRRLLSARVSAAEETVIPFQASVNDHLLATAGELPSVPIGGTDGNVALYVVVHNPGLRFTRAIDFQLTLFAPSVMDRFYVGQAISTDSLAVAPNVKAHALRRPLEVLPGSWERVYFWATGEKVWAASSQIGRFAVRVLTSSGFYDFPFVGIASDKLTPTA